MEKSQFTVSRAKNPALKCLTFLSHGTLESRDLEKTRQFYEKRGFVVTKVQNVFDKPLSST